MKGAPVAGATMTLFTEDSWPEYAGPIGTTRSDGTFDFEGLEDGMYGIRAWGPSLVPAIITPHILVAGGASVTIDKITLEHGATIRGTALHENGHAVPHSIVRAYWFRQEYAANGVLWQTSDSGQCTVETNGDFVLTGIPSGILVVSVSCDGYVGTRLPLFEVPDEPNAEAHATLTLFDPRALYGVVYDDANRPLANIGVNALGDSEYQTTTNALGEYRIGNLPPYSYTVAFFPQTESAARQFDELEVNIESNNAPHTIRLKRKR